MKINTYVARLKPRILALVYFSIFVLLYFELSTSLKRTNFISLNLIYIIPNPSAFAKGFSRTFLAGGEYGALYFPTYPTTYGLLYDPSPPCN